MRELAVAGACTSTARSVVVEVLLGDERRLERGGGARIGGRAGSGSLATSSDCTTTRSGPSSGSTS